MLRCKGCGGSPRVLSYGNELTQAIVVVCLTCKVKSTKVGGRKKIVTEGME